MSKKVVLSVLCFLLGWALARTLNVGARSPEHPVPLTAHASQIGQSADGFVPVTITKVFAIRSDNSYRESTTHMNHRTNSAITRVHVFDKQQARRTDIYPSAKVRVSYELEAEFRSGTHCTKEILEAPKAGQFLGHDVVEVVRERPVRNDLFIRTLELYAPDLNCLRVYAEAERIDRDGNPLPRFGRNIYRVNAITLGEPNPDLFDVPSDYSEVRPSQAERMALETSGFSDEEIRALAELHGDDFIKWDARYFGRMWEPAR